MTTQRLSWTRKVKTMAILASALCINTMTPAAEPEKFEVPVLEHVMTVRANVDATVEMGKTPNGVRRVVPITGGTFEGPGLSGTIMPGGEDWQLQREDGVLQLEARYWLRTDDGVIIRVNNQAIIAPRVEEQKRYIRSVVQLEAPVGKYDWINKAVFVGTLTANPAQKPPVVILNFYKVN